MSLKIRGLKSKLAANVISIDMLDSIALAIQVSHKSHKEDGHAGWYCVVTVEALARRGCVTMVCYIGTKYVVYILRGGWWFSSVSVIPQSAGWVRNPS